MLDRESSFADPETVRLLKTRYVPVAIDQAYQRRQKDTEGEFYRKIAGQGPRSDFQGTTQGFYIANAAGELLLYNNNRDPAKLRRLLGEKLAQFERSDAKSASVAPIERVTRDARYDVEPPEGGLVLRVRARVLDGYAPTDDRWARIFQTALSRDNLWVTRVEHEALVRGEIATSLARRMARFHLVDNTRGEPPMWSSREIQKLDLKLDPKPDGGELRGSVVLRTRGGERGYEAEMLGIVRAEKGRIVQCDIVARGEFWGEGTYTRGAPEGRFPLAIAFTLADGTDVADRVPPQGSRGWVDGYLKTE